jgi:choline dehydrogenase
MQVQQLSTTEVSTTEVSITEVSITEVVVIGGGTAGAVVAARLAAAGIDIVLVEAGPDYGPRSDGRWPSEILDATALATTHDWGYTSGPVAGREPWTWERARIIGGCSAHNGAIAAVGHRDDYDAWHLPGWSTDELRPLFATALETMRVRAYRPEEAGPFHARCLDAARSADWLIASDLCDLDANESFGLETVNVVDGLRWNTAFAYLDPIRGSGHLTIADRTLVDRIEVTGDGVVVHVLTDGVRRAIGADTVVVAGGVYGTPAILQRSGIGDPDRLRSVGVEPVVESPLVGSNLHDHPMVHAGRELAEDLRRAIDEATARGFVPEEQTLGKACSGLAVDGVFDLHVFPVCASTQTSLTGGRALVEVACMTPRSRGEVHITSGDPGAPPHIDHCYLTDPDDHDLTVLRDGLLIAEELLAQPALADVLIPGRPRDLSPESIRRDVMHYYHPVGTTPMGVDPASSVCDPRGRVHGTDRIVVADVSLMPQVPRANTNIPAVVVGERIASMLLS